MSALKSIIKITKIDYDTLVSNKSIVKNSVTYTYDPDQVLYIVDNGLSDQFVQLGGGGGKLLSLFATSDNVSDLANRISVEVTNRSNADSSITSALAAEVTAREATDPVFIDMSKYLSNYLISNKYISSIDHSVIMNTIMNPKRALIGYVTQNDIIKVYQYFFINAASVAGLSVNLSFIYSNNTSVFFHSIQYKTSTLLVEAVIHKQLNGIPTPVTYDTDGYQYIVDSSCLWMTLCSPRYMYVSNSTVTLDHSSVHKIFLHPTAACTYNLPSDPYNGETFEFINANYGTTYYYDYKTIIYSSGRIYCYPENGTSTAYLSSYYIYRNERCKVEFTYSSTIKGWYVIKTALVTSTLSDNPTYAGGLKPMILAYGKAGADYSSGSYVITSFTYKTFSGDTLSLSRSGRGTYVITYPAKWYTSTPNFVGTATDTSIYSSDCKLLVITTGMKSRVTYDAGSNHVYASVDNISGTKITITTADDDSLNDAMFSFIIYTMGS